MRSVVILFLGVRCAWELIKDFIGTWPTLGFFWYLCQQTFYSILLPVSMFYVLCAMCYVLCACSARARPVILPLAEVEAG